jgi:hypothetical protein
MFIRIPNRTLIFIPDYPYRIQQQENTRGKKAPDPGSATMKVMRIRNPDSQPYF